MTRIEITVKLVTSITKQTHCRRNGTTEDYDFRSTVFDTDNVTISITPGDYNCSYDSTKDEKDNLIDEIDVILQDDNEYDDSKLQKITTLINKFKNNELDNESETNVVSAYPYIAKFIKIDDDIYKAVIHVDITDIKKIYISTETHTDQYGCSCFCPSFSETIPKNLSITCPNDILDYFESYDCYYIFGKKKYGNDDNFLYQDYVIKQD